MSDYMDPRDLFPSLRSRSLGPCEVTTRTGTRTGTCGEPGVSRVLGKVVCDEHGGSASDVASYIERVMRGAS